MPKLANAKWEAFAIGLADGLTVLDAYENAGYPRSQSSASALKAKPEISERVTEILKGRRDASVREGEADLDTLPEELNKQWVIKTLMTNVGIAQTQGQISAANKAVELLAEFIGMRPKKGAKPEDEDDKDQPKDVDLDSLTNAFEKLHNVLDEREKEKEPVVEGDAS